LFIAQSHIDHLRPGCLILLMEGLQSLPSTQNKHTWPS